MRHPTLRPRIRTHFDLDEHNCPLRNCGVMKMIAQLRPIMVWSSKLKPLRGVVQKVSAQLGLNKSEPKMIQNNC